MHVYNIIINTPKKKEIDWTKGEEQTELFACPALSISGFRVQTTVEISQTEGRKGREAKPNVRIPNRKNCSVSSPFSTLELASRENKARTKHQKYLHSSPGNSIETSYKGTLKLEKYAKISSVAFN